MTLALLALLACWGGSSGEEGQSSTDPVEPDRRGLQDLNPFKSRKPAAGKGGEAFATVFGPDPCGVPALPGRGSIRFTYDGETTEVLTSVPASKGRRDLVVLLHGGKGKANNILRQTGFGEMVDDIDAVVLAPVAEAPSGSATPKWNNGKYLPSDGVRFPRNDVAYLEALVAEAKANACVDRVLVVGFSGGAVMANRWMCEGRNPPDGMLTAAGTLTHDGSKCSGPARAVRGYIGNRDERIDAPPVEGRGLSAVATLEFWARHNHCKGFDKQKFGDTTCRTWKGCDAPVSLCVVDGLGHEFPRGPRGRPATGQDATTAGWRWFEQSAKRRR